MGRNSSLIDYRDTEAAITFTVKRPSLRYLDEFLSLKCAPDLLAWGVYPNVKEISESFAAFAAVRRELGEKRLSDDKVIVYCVGDGSTPRTAACFAVRSAWLSVSIDPNLRTNHSWEARIRRLLLFPYRVENCTVGPVSPDKTRVLVAVHSHAELAACEKFQPHLVVAIPCCVPQRWRGREPDREYADWGILSPERTVKIWREAS